MVQLGVKPSGRRQLVVGTMFRNSPVIRHQDDVGAPDSRWAVRNDETGRILHQPLDPQLYLRFRSSSSLTV